MGLSHEPHKHCGKVLFFIVGTGTVLMFALGFFDRRAWTNLPLSLAFAAFGFWMWRAY